MTKIQCPVLKADKDSGKQAILTFSLPDNKYSFELAMRAEDILFTMAEYAEWLRSVCRHGDPEKVNAEECRSKFYEIAQDRNILDLLGNS